MPSPLGHALAGATAGLLIFAPPQRTGAAARLPLLSAGLVFGLVAMLPDLDLLTGWHRGPSHSLAAAAAVGLVATFWGARFGLAAGAAYATHVLLDWLGKDTSHPIGLMAFWPISSGYYQASMPVFESIARRYWIDGFLAHNLRAIARELIILAPPALAVFALRTRRAAGAARR